jgi:hypothetical protein
VFDVCASGPNFEIVPSNFQTSSLTLL